MAEDFDIEALLEAPYNKGVQTNVYEDHLGMKKGPHLPT